MTENKDPLELNIEAEVLKNKGELIDSKITNFQTTKKPVEAEYGKKEPSKSIKDLDNYDSNNPPLEKQKTIMSGKKSINLNRTT